MTQEENALQTETRNPWIFYGLTALLWLTWLYPFLRLVLILPIAATQDVLPEKTVKTLLTGAKYFHGGEGVSALMPTWYMGYFAVSICLYFFWHYKTATRIGWFERVALLLVIIMNILNVFLLRAVTEMPA